jgi:hypothetical protein
MNVYLHILKPPEILCFAVGGDHFQWCPSHSAGFRQGARTDTGPAVTAGVCYHGMSGRHSPTSFFELCIGGAVSITCQALRVFGWFLDCPEIRVDSVSGIPETGPGFLRGGSVFLLAEKLQTLLSAVQQLPTQKRSSLRFCRKVLGQLVASFEAVPYAQFHARVLRRELLSRWE